MLLIALSVLLTNTIILQNFPQYSNFQINSPEFKCDNVVLTTENASFYIDSQQDSSIIQKTANNFEELFNNKWNSTFINLIYEQEFLPQNILILQTERILFEKIQLLCSLIQYKQNQEYQIYCTQELKQINDDKIKFNIIHQFSLSILNEKNHSCKSFQFAIHQFYIFCRNDDYLIIITLDKQGNQQLEKIQISNSKCKTQFKYSLELFIVSLYQCLKWEIIILDLEISIVQRITISELQSKKNDTFQNLLDIQYCQENMILNFESSYVQIDFSNSYKNIKYQFFSQNENTELIKCLKQSKFYFLDFIQEGHSILISYALSQDWKDILILGNQIMLFQYSDHLVAMLANEIKQIINIEINQLVLLKDNIQFLIIDHFNKLSLFKINSFQISYSYQQNQNYVGFFQVKQFQLSFIKCFELKQYKDEQLKLLDQISNLRYKNYLIKVDDKFDNKILIDKQSFIQEENIHLDFSFPNLFQIKDIQNENKNQSFKLKRKFNNFQLFYILNRNSKTYILFNDENLQLVIYNCSSSRFVKYNLNVDLNTTQTYYEAANLHFILIQETLGKVISFDLSSKQETSINYKIYQFKEQIRISCIYLNSLIIQIVNSTEIYFEFQKANKFMNFPIHKAEHFNFIFYQNFYRAIKILALQNTFIFQLESYLLIYQSNLLYLIINKKLNILGGYVYNSKSLQLILVAIDQETTIYKYLITKLDYYLISTFSSTDYIPIQPLRYQIQQNHFIMVTAKQNLTIFYLLLFNLLNCNSFNYYETVSTPNQYFYIQQDNLYYYNDQELIEKQLKYYTFNFQVQELDQIFYKLELKINLNYSTSLQNYNYKEKLNLILFNSQFDLKLINQYNSKIAIKQDQGIIYPNQYVVGGFNEISLINNTAFVIQSPFKVTNRIQCYYIYNAVCLIQDSKNIQLYDLSNNILIDQPLNLRIMIQNKANMFSNDKGFVLVEQLDSDLVEITCFTQNKRINQSMIGIFLSASLKQSVLMVQTNNLTNYYFIDEKFHLLLSHNFDFPNKHFSFYQIGKKQVCQILFQIEEISINCFQISQNTVQPVKNYTILIKNIYNQLKSYWFLPNFLEKFDIEFLNLSQIQENELDLKFLLYLQMELLFYFQITLNSFGNHIKLNNIIRYPKLVQICSSYILNVNVYF